MQHFRVLYCDFYRKSCQHCYDNYIYIYIYLRAQGKKVPS